MATDDTANSKKAGRGFAGLSTMVSDVDATIEKHGVSDTTAAPAPAAGSTGRSPTARTANDQEPRQYADPSPPSSGGASGLNWILGVAAVLGAIWFFSESSKTPSTRPTTSYSDPAPTTNAAPAPRVVPAAPPPTATRPPSLAVEKPPPGRSNVLGVAQIRYCLAEDIRIEAAKPVVNDFIDADVDRFNAMVEDYNSRCGSFKYRKGALETARSDVEAMRPTLQLEGRRRFVKQEAVTGPFDDIPLAPDPTVLAIQNRLAALGYGVGTPDGFVGPKTRNAITAYQKSSGLNADGQASASLLARLNAPSPAPAQVAAQPAFVPPPVVTPAPPAVSMQRVPPPVAIAPESSQAPGKPDLSAVSSDEREAIERTCDYDQRVNGPAQYYACLRRELRSLSAYRGKPDLSRASPDEREAIERTCDYDRRVNGPASYYGCLTREVSSLRSFQGKPDLSGVSPSEREAMERTCDYDRRVNGPARYYACLTSEVNSLRGLKGRPDLSGVSPSERDAIERACDYDRRVNGPARYYSCLSRELSSLSSFRGKPDTTRASAGEQDAIERACDYDRRVNGPAKYYSCISREMTKLGFR